MIIETSNISKTFNQGKHNEIEILHSISIDIREGDMVAICGPSGAGKSTLLSILGCLDPPTSGTYLLEGQNIAQAKSRQLATIRNSKIGFIMQSYALIEDESALENILTPVYFSKSSLKTMEPKAICIMESLGISDLANKKVCNLSGGEKQRVAIARATIRDPQIILADEPTGSLDAENSQMVMDIFSRLNAAGCTIIIITHEASIAVQCNRIIHILDGRISEDETIDIA